ncbi:CHAT domain-containing protein [Mycena sp. CBHHK59/15]|nr:CHAT domain-containing protein [Mycena sp. CBHHK59/15]
MSGQVDPIPDDQHELHSEPSANVGPEASDSMPAGYPDLPQHQEKLGNAFAQRYHKLGDLEEAILNKQEAVKATPADDPERAGCLHTLAVSLTDRCRWLGDQNDLETTLKIKQEVLDLTPTYHPDRPRYLQALAVSLSDRYQRLGDLDDLGSALQYNMEAVDLTSANHPDRPGRLHTLAVLLSDRYRRLGDLDDLGSALQYNTEAVDLTPANHPDRPGCLHTLAVFLSDRYRPGHLHTLAAFLSDPYRQLGNLNDLETALKIKQEVVSLTPTDHPDRPRCLQALAASNSDRYRRLGDLKDLEAAIQTDQEAMDLTPANHPDRPGCLQILAVSLLDRYRRLGDLNDLEVALKTQQSAVALTPKDHPDRPGCLQALAVSFKDRYRRLGNLQDLEAALQTEQEAVDLTPADHPERPRRLRSLAGSFTNRFQRLGDLKDLGTALQKNIEAVNLTPAGDPDRPGCLQSLATSFRDQYQILGDLDDLHTALQNNMEAVDLTPAGHPDKPGCLQSLAASSTARYERLGDTNELKSAVQATQEALDLTPMNHPDRARYLKSLTESLRALSIQSRKTEDLEAVIQTAQEAVNLIPTNHPDHPKYLQVLAVSLSDRYHRSGDLRDLDVAMQKVQEAVDLTPANHPNRAGLLQNLAVLFADRYRRSGNQMDLEHVHIHYADSFNTSISDPGLSWKAALDWAAFSEEFQPSDVAASYQAAFHLLPQILWMGHTIPVKHATINRLDIASATSAAVRSFIKLGHLGSGVKILEQGVGTTFHQMLQLKPDVNQLSPEQAAVLQKLSSVLYSGTTINLSMVERQRMELLEQIRKRLGLEHFLLPKLYSALAHAARNGPVVILNSHAEGCDGIIILNPDSEPAHVYFRLLGQCNINVRNPGSTKLSDHSEDLTSTVIQKGFKEVLAWLWTNVVGPVYQVLGSHGIDTGRLWWLPIGSFSGFPFHASAAEDPFIHSYTATLGSLLEAQSKKSSGTQPNVGVIGVTHTGSGSENYLKGVEEEVKQIRSIIQGPNLKCLQGEQATPDVVKLQLRSCSWIHFACHGTQDLVEPTKSRLLLYESHLELETILQMLFSDTEFIFLAASQTAMGDAELVNESFHISGGFIAAGFKSAVGTLWSMNDEDGSVVASLFYYHLFREGRQPQASDTAEALNLAVKELRAANVPYERWVPFVHLGV